MIAPEQPGINSIPEIRTITRLHHVSLLNGPVSKRDIYDACRNSTFQGIHIASHGSPDAICLSNAELLTGEDIAQLGRISEAVFVFSNTCMSAQMASYLVRHGITYVIHTTGDIKDAEAWKLPAAFYDVLQNGHGKDVVGAFRVADSGDSDYELKIDPDLIDRALLALAEKEAVRRQPIQLTPTRIALIFTGMAVTIAALVQIMTYLAGGFK